MKSTIAHKTLMALTGLFLCLFLMIHLLGNLLLFLPGDQARSQFNWYANALYHSLRIEVAAIGTYLAILAHTVLALITTVRNRRAAGSGYEVTAPATSAPWYSRSMGKFSRQVVDSPSFWREPKTDRLSEDLWTFNDGFSLAVASFVACRGE